MSDFDFSHGPEDIATTTIPYKDYIALIAERDRLRNALTKIAGSSPYLPGKMFIEYARAAVTHAALKGGGDE